MGCHDCRRARFSNYWLAPDGQCQGPDPAGRTVGETENFVADHYDRFLSGAPFDGGTAIRRFKVGMVGARLDRSRSGTSLDHRGTDDLLRCWLRLAESRATCARPITTIGIDD